jgi:FkbM family methyltransferase
MPQPPRTALGRLVAGATTLVSGDRPDKLSHRNALKRLGAAGFTPKTIYDIGAYRGGWTRLASEVFPEAAFVLFEANADNAAFLASTGHRHFIAALSDRDGAGTFFLPRAADISGASLYVENTAHYAGDSLVSREVAVARLDTLVAQHDLPLPDLIKLDVQGAELDVMAGGGSALAHCDAIIAELAFANYNEGAPLVADCMAAIARHDLRCIDVCELHRAPSGTVLQADFLFAKPPLFTALCAQAGVTRHATHSGGTGAQQR